MTHGWGATCDGVCTGGPWSTEETQWDINCLEALAAFHAVRCFVRDRRYASLLLRLDNTSAVCYINKLGGTVSARLNAIVRDLWLWCMNRGITLDAKHLPGVLNTVADEESSDEGSLGLDAPPSGIPPDPAALGPIGGGPVCVQADRGSSAGDQTQRQRLSVRTGHNSSGRRMPTPRGI